MFRKLLMVTAAAGLMATAGGATAEAGMVTFTGSDLGDAGVQLSVPAISIGGTGTATYISGQITLNINNSSNSYRDTAQIQIANGAMVSSTGGTVVLGTLSSFLASGANFNLVSSSGLPNYDAYWDMTITNGSNTYQINSYAGNVLGTNTINEGQATSISCDETLAGTPLPACFFEPWSTFTSTLLDGVALGTYDVSNVTIDVGGWGPSAGLVTDVIDSISLPGTPGSGNITNISPVPEPASMALLGTALAGLGLLRRRQRRIA